MSPEWITATAGVIGAAIGVGSAAIGAGITGRSQRKQAQRDLEQKACSTYLAALDVYLVSVEELRWAKKNARRKDGDIRTATSEWRDHYRSAWFGFLTANATVQLVALRHIAESAANAKTCATTVDNLRWDYIEYGNNAPGFEASITELRTLRDAFKDIVRSGAAH